MNAKITGEKAEETIDAIAEHAHDLADRGQAALAHGRDQACESLHRANAWASDCLTSRPLTSMAIAAAAGAALALFLGPRRS